MLVALGSVGAAWLEARPKPTPRDAAVLAERAVRAAGVAIAPVADADVAAGVYDNAAARAHFDVWHVMVHLEHGAVIELDVDRDNGGFVQLNDVVGGRYVLTDQQAQAISDFDSRFPSLDARLRRNFAAAAAGLLIAGVAVCITRFGPRRGAARRAGRPPPRA